jgi:hypothetical protein
MKPDGRYQGIPRLPLILAASSILFSNSGLSQPVSLEPATAQEPAADLSSSPSGVARILAPGLPDEPAAGKGRLTLLFSGDHRWCTYPDDRPIKPPEDPRKAERDQKRNEIFTFGYQFTIAAIKRGAPGRPIMLFESPFFQTASLRLAQKLGLGQPSRKVVVGPSVGMHPMAGGHRPVENPDALVPYWEERNRCVTLPERFDFDVDPGTYDVYIAFDVMNGSQAWAHRMADYLTEVPVEQMRRTSLQGTVGMSGPSGRELSLQGASLQPAGANGS